VTASCKIANNPWTTTGRRRHAVAERRQTGAAADPARPPPGIAAEGAKARAFADVVNVIASNS
jgi:hypothetical protein